MLSLTEPDTYRSIATDWCNPVVIPHNHQGPKGWLVKKRPKVSLFGMVDISATTSLHLIHHMEWWKHTANLHISILYDHLRKLRSKGKLPPHLLLQFDNCAKDNKNRWLLAFLAHILHKKWCKTITIFYLMPGHSHDMVDSECFAPVGRKYRRIYDVWTYSQFPAWLSRAWKKRKVQPTISDSVVVYDWKRFLTPHLRAFSQHSFPRAFLLKEGVDNEGNSQIVLFYKKSVLSQVWLGYCSKYFFIPLLNLRISLTRNLHFNLPSYWIS